MPLPSEGKPLPQITEFTRPFWTSAKHGKLVVQKCSRCGTMDFFPKPWCIECGHRGLEWVEAKPDGTVYSYTVSHTVMMNYPAWKNDLPIVLCIVELDDGPRMYAQLTNCDPTAVRIGMRVKAHFEDISEQAGIPKFRPL